MSEQAILQFTTPEGRETFETVVIERKKTQVLLSDGRRFDTKGFPVNTNGSHRFTSPVEKLWPYDVDWLDHMQRKTVTAWLERIQWHMFPVGVLKDVVHLLEAYEQQHGIKLEYIAMSPLQKE